MRGKIVYFANASVPSRTANSVHILKMCEALGRQGHEVFLVVPDQPLAALRRENPFRFYGVEEAFRIRRAKWLRVHPTGWLDVLYVIYGALLLRLRLRPAVCITRNLWAGLIFPRLGIRTILELHQPVDGRSRMALLLRRFRAFEHARFVRLVVISHPLRASFLDFGVPSAKIQVLPDAVNVRQFAVPGPVRAVSGPLAVGYAGSMFQGKGMEVIAALAARDPGNEYHVYGGSPEENAHWGRRASPNLKLHGHVPNGDIPGKLAVLDVLLMPYQSRVSVTGNYGNVAQWMSPLKMFEYMAAGKAIVSSNLEVLREVLEDGRNALLVDPERVEDWVGAIRRLAGDPGLRERLGLAARADVVANYTWEQRAIRILR